MVNPELGLYQIPEITREQSERFIQELSEAAEEVRHNLVNHSPHRPLLNPEDYYPEEIGRLKRAVTASRGLPVEGRTDTTAYYVEENGVFQRGHLGLTPVAMPHYFHGIVHDLDEVHLPGLRGFTKQLCLAIAPLDRLLGWRFDAQLDSHYKHLGRVNMLYHPFDKQEHQGKVLYIPMSYITDRGIKLLDDWKRDQ